jgi:DNA-binding NarL/FixJ family response regulator
MANRQIAEQLVLSPRTVGTHVSHILAKLGVRSRIDIAREAAENDRVPN